VQFQLDAILFGGNYAALMMME